MKSIILNLNFAVNKTAVITSFKGGHVYRFEEALTTPGGKGVNVARALRALGEEVPLTGFISGHNGHWIRAALKKEGFDFFAEQHNVGESRICYTIVDAKGRSTDINEDGPIVPTEIQNKFLIKFRKLCSRGGLVAICGRESRGLKQGFYSELIQIAKAKNSLVIIDTSGHVLKESLDAGVSGIKINRMEFEELLGKRFSVKLFNDFFKTYSPKGLKLVIVTNGPKPSYAVTSFGMWKIIPPVLKKLKSPTGAGDSFMAGFLYGFLNNHSFEQSLKTGAGTAAADCLTVGAGLIDKKTALDYEGKTKVLQIK